MLYLFLFQCYHISIQRILILKDKIYDCKALRNIVYKLRCLHNKVDKHRILHVVGL